MASGRSDCLRPDGSADESCFISYLSLSTFFYHPSHLPAPDPLLQSSYNSSYIYHFKLN